MCYGTEVILYSVCQKRDFLTNKSLSEKKVLFCLQVKKNNIPLRS